MRIFFILSLYFSILLALSSGDVVDFYEKNLPKDEILKVKEVDGTYIILSSTIDFGKDESRKLNLIAKYLLLKHLKKRDKKITTVTLHGFENASKWKKNGRIYLLSYINQEQIESSYALKKKKKQKSIIDQEIVLLEKIKNKNETIHSQLKNLYFQKGDMDNYSREVDFLIDIKFNEL